jgi:hypothetical protein
MSALHAPVSPTDATDGAPTDATDGAPTDATDGAPGLQSRRHEALQALLRERKLDRTLTTVCPPTAESSAPFHLEALDRVLRGGLPRGQTSEIVGPASSGRTSLAWAALSAATSRGELVALIDTFDRFDPGTAAEAGLALSQLLWVRGQALSKTAGALDPAWVPGVRAASGPGTLLERTVDRAIKALNLIVQSGVCTLVVLDLIDVPAAGLARVPMATWLRIQRVVEGTDTAVLLLATTPVARSAGGLSIGMGVQGARGARGAQGAQGARGAQGAQGARGARGAQVIWKGAHDRSRRLGGITADLRATSPRGFVGELTVTMSR